MKKNLNSSLLISTIASAIFITGCAGGAMSSRETTAVIGSIIGSEIGKEFGGGHGKRVTRLIGAAIGGYIGANLGRPLDGNDQRNIHQAMSTAPDNSKVRWQNNQSGAQYAITPTNSYQSSVNQTPAQCRNYTMTVDMGGSPQFVQGKACMVNGKWVNA
jgi:surface antigen